MVHETALLIYHTFCGNTVVVVFQLLLKYNHTLMQNYISSFWTINRQVRETRSEEREQDAWFCNYFPQYQKSLS